MRLLLTRPEAESRALAARLAASGILATVAPLLRIETEAVALADLATALDGVRGLVFTSSHGVAAFAALESRRDLPVFAVGPATETAARGAGFAVVHGADGDQADWAKLVAER